MTISIEEMRSFAAVAAQGTFSAAARALGRSQSVVSTHIAGMENELGIRLFVRGTPAKLTPAGEELLPGALRVLREAERFESRASELFRLPEPLLYMGIDMALELPLLLDLLRDFSRQFPSARLQLENISSSESNWFFRRSHMTMAVIFSSRPDPECESISSDSRPARWRSRRSIRSRQSSAPRSRHFRACGRSSSTPATASRSPRSP